MATILVLHGPNLNLLGQREPDKYGATSLAQIDQALQIRARKAGHHLQHMQSNAEYELIERIHAARAEGVDFILINPAAFTHTSVALRDALLAVSMSSDNELSAILGVVALVFATINVVGGFMVTDRMLAKFKRKG